jgi:16S rRNA C967 or C1407 C5-methylase (RsmB/RsmF family)
MLLLILAPAAGIITVHFAKLTAPDRKVYAVDSDKALLARIEKKIKRQQLINW